MTPINPKIKEAKKNDPIFDSVQPLQKHSEPLINNSKIPEPIVESKQSDQIKPINKDPVADLPAKQMENFWGDMQSSFSESNDQRYSFKNLTF